MAAADTHRILPAWPEQLVYEELDGPGAQRRLEFGCRSMNDPIQVDVPAAARWAEKTPGWAHERRDLIVQRLRDARCVPFEVDTDRASATSPDGTIQVEQLREYDDRSGLWESIRVIALPSHDVLASVLNYGASDWFAFPGPGRIDFEVTDRLSRRHRIRIDANARTFTLLPAGLPEPLAELPVRLGMVTSVHLYEPPRRNSALGRAGVLLTVLASLVLTGGGVWIAAHGPTTKERILGAVAALFFAACTYLPWAESRQRRHSDRER